MIFIKLVSVPNRFNDVLMMRLNVATGILAKMFEILIGDFFKLKMIFEFQINYFMDSL